MAFKSDAQRKGFFGNKGGSVKGASNVPAPTHRNIVHPFGGTEAERVKLIRQQPSDLLELNLKVGHMTKKTENIIKDELKKRKQLNKDFKDISKKASDKLKERSSLFTNEGFQIVEGKRNTGKELYSQNGVFVRKSYIPYTNTSSTIVYFVSGDNGDEFGQFTTRNKALIKGREMAKLSQKQRGRFDQ